MDHNRLTTLIDQKIKPGFFHSFIVAPTAYHQTKSLITRDFLHTAGKASKKGIGKITCQ